MPESVIGWIGGVLLVIVAVVAAVLWWSWATVVMWGWFMVPLGLPALSIPQVAGISGLISLFKGPNTKKSEDKEWPEGLTLIVLSPAFILAFGWVALQFV